MSSIAKYSPRNGFRIGPLRAATVARPWLVRVAGRPAAAAASLREPPPCAVDASSIAAPAQVLLDPVAPAAPLSSSRSLHFALGPRGNLDILGDVSYVIA